MDTLGDMDESQRWDEFGVWLVDQRKRLKLSRRQAAKRAGVSEGAWRDLETGRKVTVGGIKLLPNVSTEVLEKVAVTLEVPLDEVLRHVGRAPGGGASGPGVRARPSESSRSRLTLVQKISRLPYRDRRLVERLVDGMLEEGDS